MHQQEGRDPLLSARAKAAHLTQMSETDKQEEDEHHHHSYNTRYQERWESEHPINVEEHGGSYDDTVDGDETQGSSGNAVWKVMWSEEHQREFYVNSLSNEVSWYAPSVSIPRNGAGADEELSPDYSTAYEENESSIPLAGIGKGRILATLFVLALGLHGWMQLCSEDGPESLSHTPGADSILEPVPATTLDAIAVVEKQDTTSDDDTEIAVVDKDEDDDLEEEQEEEDQQSVLDEPEETGKEDNVAENDKITINKPPVNHDYPSVLKSAQAIAETVQPSIHQTVMAPDSAHEETCSLFEHHVILPIKLTAALSEHSHDVEHAQSILSRLELEMLVYEHPKGLCKLPMSHQLFPKKCKLSYLVNELN